MTDIIGKAEPSEFLRTLYFITAHNPTVPTRYYRATYPCSSLLYLWLARLGGLELFRTGTGMGLPQKLACFGCEGYQLSRLETSQLRYRYLSL